MNTTCVLEASSQPTSAFPKQAIVVIHGMGEQKPMDTIRDFVKAVWETDTIITANGLPNPAEVWSKPDLRTGSLELRRITTRQSVGSPAFPTGVRSDFYELYWADLSGGSTWDGVKDWIFGLLLRNPFTNVPTSVLLAWAALWLVTLIVLFFVVAATLPSNASIAGIPLWKCVPLRWVSDWQTWQLALMAGAFALGERALVTPYFGRVVRYTRATPDNIAAREKIRDRGLTLLSELHNQDYDRIVIVGHSLGSILAYDLVSYFWASRYDQRTVSVGTPEFEALKVLEQAAATLEATATAEKIEAAQKAYHASRATFAALLQHRPKPAPGTPDSRWLITDLITVGSPLGHAEFLMARSADDLRRHQGDREFPVCPPIRELLDPDNRKEAVKAGFLSGNPDKLFCFPFGTKGQWQLHHAAPFAAVRWTNIHDPARLIFCGDIISGPVAPMFGTGPIDIDLRARIGASWTFTHIKYWALGGARAQKRLQILRDVLNLACR